MFTIGRYGRRLTDERAIAELGEIGLEPVQSGGPAVLQPRCLRSRGIDAALRDRLVDKQEHVVARERRAQPDIWCGLDHLCLW